MNKKLSVLITGSSRPKLIKLFWESFQRMVIMRTYPKIYYHEDIVYLKASQKVINYMQPKVDDIQSTSPARGLAYVLDHYIKNIETEYVLYYQEDWETNQPIDVDRLVWCMDNNPEINMIVLPKNTVTERSHGTHQKQFTYSGVDMCVYHGISLNPGLWRMSFIKDNWKFREDRPEGAFAKQFGNHETRLSTGYCVENIGCYLLGGYNTYRYVRHLGDSWRMAKWRLEKGKPGSTLNKTREELETNDKDLRPPWTPYKKIPFYQGEEIA